jgi:uncharacterized protein (TIGR03437 family)
LKNRKDKEERMRRPSIHTFRLVCQVSALVGLLEVSSSVFTPVALGQSSVTSPAWTSTGSLSTNRIGHTATLLRNGKVLVVGGVGFPCSGNFCFSTTYNSAELYDPATGRWAYTGSLNRRIHHTATLLPNGQVLVAGGRNFDRDIIGTDSYLNSAEVYDPATEKWHPTGSLTIIRGFHSAVLLPTGKVLAVGSPDFNSRPRVWSAELYDPATEKWSSTGTPTMLVFGFSVLTLLPNGKVLTVSGYDAELYDPVTGKWSSTDKLKVIRRAVTITLLPNGKVLVTGSQDYANLVLAELYDPATGTWSATGSHNNKFYGSWPTLLPDGKVLLAGGTDGNFRSLRNAEIYDPATGVWTATSSMITARQHHTVTLLSGGKVLVTGGYDGDYDSGGTYLSSTEMFDPGLPQAGMVASVSAASFDLSGLTSEGITASFGADLATAPVGATTLPLPTQLAGTTVKVKDSASIERLAPLFFVSPTQVNYQIPPGTAAGAATVIISSGDGTVSSGIALIKAVAPSLFTASADGSGVASALALRVKADGSQSYEPVAQFDPAQAKFVSRPLDLGPEGEQVYLVLFGTGIRQRSSLSAVIATIGGEYAEVGYAGAQGEFVGLDQINLRIPRSLAGRGEMDVLLTVEAQLANPVRVNSK